MQWFKKKQEPILVEVVIKVILLNPVKLEEPLEIPKIILLNIPDNFTVEKLKHYIIAKYEIENVVHLLFEGNILNDDMILPKESFENMKTLEDNDERFLEPKLICAVDMKDFPPRKDAELYAAMENEFKKSDFEKPSPILEEETPYVEKVIELPSSFDLRKELRGIQCEIFYDMLNKANFNQEVRAKCHFLYHFSHISTYMYCGYYLGGICSISRRRFR